MIRKVDKTYRANGSHALCICDWCGKETRKKYSQALKTKHHFCNKECFSKWYSKNMSGKNGSRYGTGRKPETIANVEKYMKDKNKKGGRSNYRKTKNSLGYTLIYMPEHPYSTKLGYISEHRLIMENAIGRYLKKNEIVHHIDGDVTNNNLENLMYFQDNGEHIRWHRTVKKMIHWKLRPKNKVVIAEGIIDKQGHLIIKNWMTTIKKMVKNKGKKIKIILIED